MKALRDGQNLNKERWEGEYFQKEGEAWRKEQGTIISILAEECGTQRRRAGREAVPVVRASCWRAASTLLWAFDFRSVGNTGPSRFLSRERWGQKLGLRNGHRIPLCRILEEGCGERDHSEPSWRGRKSWTEGAEEMERGWLWGRKELELINSVPDWMWRAKGKKRQPRFCAY